MNELIYAWELGGGIGHMAHARAVQTALAPHGFGVVPILADLAVAGTLFPEPETRLLQAPRWMRPPPASTLPASYAEILAFGGFGTRAGLAALTRAWLCLFDAVGPAAVIADHAPTALLAARCRTWPTIATGTGFACPPRGIATPRFRTWESVPEARLAAAEAMVLENANGVLADLGGRPLHRLADLFDVDDTLVMVQPELDPYDALRGGTVQFGPLSGEFPGVPARWPEHPGLKVFAYLRPEYRGLDEVLAALAGTRFNALAFIPDAPQRVVSACEHHGITLSRSPIDLASALEETAIVVCHGTSTMAATLAHGVPLLALPMQAEQLCSAMRLGGE